jgi:hypothetical protein
MIRSAVQYESMILRCQADECLRVDTVRISAAGQTLGACNFTMGMRTSAVRSSLYSSCTRLRALGRSDQNGTGADSKRWLGKKRDETAHTLCTIHFACSVSKRYFAARDAAERGRVDSPASASLASLARSLSYCAARERVGSVYAGDGDSIRQVHSVCPIVREKRRWRSSVSLPFLTFAQICY